MFSNILIYFVVIPLIMLLGLFLCRDIKQIRAVAVTGSIALTALSIWLLVDYLGLRAAGNDAPMLYLGSWEWFAPLNIHLAVGVDGISSSYQPVCMASSYLLTCSQCSCSMRLPLSRCIFLSVFGGQATRTIQP